MLVFYSPIQSYKVGNTSENIVFKMESERDWPLTSVLLEHNCDSEL